jgi:hypothetical protein
MATGYPLPGNGLPGSNRALSQRQRILGSGQIARIPFENGISVRVDIRFFRQTRGELTAMEASNSMQPIWK